jgi:hypothetical protein
VLRSVAQHEQEEAQQRAQQARTRPRAAPSAAACLHQSPFFVHVSGCERFGQGSPAAGNDVLQACCASGVAGEVSGRYAGPALTALVPLQVKRVRCEASGVLVAKDKAIKRFIVRNIVDASAIRDIQDCSVVDGAPPANRDLVVRAADAATPAAALLQAGNNEESSSALCVV